MLGRRRSLPPGSSASTTFSVAWTIRTCACWMPDPGPNTTRGTSRVPLWVDAKAVEKLSTRPGALADRRPGNRGSSLWASARRRVCSFTTPSDSSTRRGSGGCSRYLGVEHVGLINGGFPLWVKEKQTGDIRGAEGHTLGTSRSTSATTASPPGAMFWTP